MKINSDLKLADYFPKEHLVEVGGWPMPDIRPETMGCYTCHSPIPYKMGGGYCDNCCPVMNWVRKIREAQSREVQAIYEQTI